MKLRQIFYAGLISSAVSFSSCNNEDKKTEPETKETEMKEPKLKEDIVSYTGDGITMWDPLESTCRHASLSIL